MCYSKQDSKLERGDHEKVYNQTSFWSPSRGFEIDLKEGKKRAVRKDNTLETKGLMILEKVFSKVDIVLTNEISQYLRNEVCQIEIRG